MTASLTPPRMPLWTKAAYGFADTGINVFVIFKGLLILAFMVQYAGIDPALAGWVTSSVLVLDIITDPIMLAPPNWRTFWSSSPLYLQRGGADGRADGADLAVLGWGQAAALWIRCSSG